MGFNQKKKRVRFLLCHSVSGRWQKGPREASIPPTLAHSGPKEVRAQRSLGPVTPQSRDRHRVGKGGEVAQAIQARNGYIDKTIGGGYGLGAIHGARKALRSKKLSSVWPSGQPQPDNVRKPRPHDILRR
jgi:hypothetical protein